MIDLWYKNAILYCLDVGTFADGYGDGVGDFRGLGDRLPYLAGIGVTCVWLVPFYPSPMRDDGYDISDYYGVHPRYGTLGGGTTETLKELVGKKIMNDFPVDGFLGMGTF